MWAPNNIPLIYNLEWDPREGHQVDFTHAWVLQPIAVAAGRFLLAWPAARTLSLAGPAGLCLRLDLLRRLVGAGVDLTWRRPCSAP